MNTKPGTYLLILKSKLSLNAKIGHWGTLALSKGYYLYVGSAFGPGGLLARVSRHCREDKSKRWHIDYLRQVTNPVVVWYSYGPERYEHLWAEALAKRSEITPIKGFGCSDCRCEAHLFFTKTKPELAQYSKGLKGRLYSWSCNTAD